MSSGRRLLLLLISNRFYQSHGFVPVDSFELRKGDIVWPGMLLRMDIDESISG